MQIVPTIQLVHLESIQNAAAETPAETTAPKPADEKPAAAPAQRPAASIVNTTTLTDQEEFRTTAEELFKTFTEEDRLAAFTRARPKTFEGAKKGGKFELFDGNVAGEYLELEEPTKIVQSWRLKQWPEGHYSKQDIEFVQNDEDGVTVMRVTWTGVPLGQEEVTKENWGEYYVRSIKRTFGYVNFYLTPLVIACHNMLTIIQIRYHPLVLHGAIHKFDACIGVSWRTVEGWARSSP